MADSSRRTDQLPVKTSANNTNDKLIILYAPNTAYAQTALLAIKDLLGNTANLHVVCANIVFSNVTLTTPANSEALTIKQGTLFFTDSHGYLATSNNHVKRWSLLDF